MNHRQDIDGVRGIAVLSVIMAHAGVPAISGGFLGVDVFFVISGFLITSIIRADMDAEKFSLARFYEKRARRLFPALLLVIMACIPFALWLMLPDFLQNFGQSVVATLLFANNLLLAATSGYWDLESNFKPLLHTWTLGVEEQFYLVFPLFLAFLWRYGTRAQLAGIAIVGMISFGLAEIGWRNFPEANFYLPTSRAWELMAGCAAAYVVRKDRPIDDALAFAGLILVVGSMFLFTERTPSPSVFTAVPVLGTVAIVLFSRPGTLAYRMLSFRPLVFIGLISYSAYLWHHPLYAFARVGSLTPPSAFEMAALTAGTVALAALTWYYVEEPFRRSVPLRRVILTVAPATVALMGLGLAAHVKQGFPEWTFPNIDKGGVYITYNERIRQFSADTFPTNGQPNILLVGDSYARDVGNVLMEAGAFDAKNVIYVPRYPACRDTSIDPPNDQALYRAADLVIVALHGHDGLCVRAMKARINEMADARAIFFGSKDFGYNVNPFARVPLDKRVSAFVMVPGRERENNEAASAALDGDYVDMIRLLGPDGKRMHFFDERGNPVTPDRWHLTRYGAIVVAKHLPVAYPNIWAVVKRGGR